MTKDDGGPAAPTVAHGEVSPLGGWFVSATLGMSLKDYIAAAALQGMLSNGSCLSPGHCAAMAYEYAEEMLRLRGEPLQIQNWAGPADRRVSHKGTS